MNESSNERSGMSEDDFGTGDPRCPLVLLLDTSWSMGTTSGSGLLPIDQLNKGLQTLSECLQENRVARRRVEILVIPFGGTVAPIGKFELARDWVPPILTANGSTPMGAAVRAGLNAVTDRRRELQQEGTPPYRPWVFLLTDGEPTDDVDSVPSLIMQAESSKRALFWCIAAEGADVSVLRNFTPGKPILQLDNADWSSLFEWMSAAVSEVARSNPDDQISIDPWTMTI